MIYSRPAQAKCSNEIMTTCRIKSKTNKSILILKAIITSISVYLLLINLHNATDVSSFIYKPLKTSFGRRQRRLLSLTRSRYYQYRHREYKIFICWELSNLIEYDTIQESEYVDVTTVTSALPLDSTTTPAVSNTIDTVIDQQHQRQHQQQERCVLRRIPYEQRVTQPRLARRMNHSFKYLYRHGFDETVLSMSKINVNVNATTAATIDMEDPMTFLRLYGNYSHEQILQMNASFPMLLQLSVRQQLFPKIQFLKYTLRLSGNTSTTSLVPPYYYGTRLERIIAPRHAFLVWTRNLPFGLQLLVPMNTENNATIIRNDCDTTINNHMQCKFHEFLCTCRNSKHFAAMCQKWANEKNSQNDIDTTKAEKVFNKYTAKDVEAFDMIFGRGLLSICRNDIVQENNTWAMDQLQPYQLLRASDFIPILISHGANVYERDHRGATLLHWACGTGHLDIVQELVPYFSVNGTAVIRDGATLLHWSAAGCNTREFGIGGHVDICEYLIDRIRTSSSSITVNNFINQCTYDGNSALMWAAWSGTIETVKLLVRNKANSTLRNRNGCSVAHWAASSGNVEVCRYLHTIANVDFCVINYAGNSPLSHAVAFGRTGVVEWLIQVVKEQKVEDKMLFCSLAQDFITQTEGEEKLKRSEILKQFDDKDWIPSTTVIMSS